MTHDYKKALDDLEERESFFPEHLSVFISSPLDLLTYKTIRHALELAIALQPKPISEAAIGQWVLTYSPVAALACAPKYEAIIVPKPLHDIGLNPTHFYDISALPKPEVTE